MAIKTFQVASFANGLVTAEIDLNDANLRVMAARIINSSAYPALIEVYKAGSLAASQTVNSGQTISKNLPAAIKFAMDAGDPAWGIPPEMTMGDIEIYCKWG